MFISGSSSDKPVASEFQAAEQPMKAIMKRRSSKHLSSPATATGTAKTKRSRADRAAVKMFMSLLRNGADSRLKKVKRIRQSVRTRSYENDLKLSVAAERLARELSA
jgi:hypothetical protein